MAQSQRQRQVTPQLPLVLREPVEVPLVAPIGPAADVALGLNVRLEVTAGTAPGWSSCSRPRARWTKSVGRDVAPGVDAELEVVAPLHVRHVVDELVGVLHAGLRRAVKGSELQIQILLDRDVRKHVQARILEVACRNGVRVAAVGEPQFVEQPWREGVKLGQVEHALADRCGCWRRPGDSARCRCRCRRSSSQRSGTGTGRLRGRCSRRCRPSCRCSGSSGS